MLIRANALSLSSFMVDRKYDLISLRRLNERSAVAEDIAIVLKIR